VALVDEQIKMSGGILQYCKKVIPRV
jgi:hypothetical protein